MRACIGAAAVVAAVLASTAGAAVAQYVGPFNRNFPGQPECPIGSVFRGNACVDGGRAGYAQPSQDWRRDRQRQLEDSQRPAFVRERERDDWRYQRQREIDERFGRVVKPTENNRCPDSYVLRGRECVGIYQQ